MIGTEHLLLSILKNKENIVTETLNRLGIDYDIFRTELDLIQNDIKGEMPGEQDDEGFEEELSSLTLFQSDDEYTYSKIFCKRKTGSFLCLAFSI